MPRSVQNHKMRKSRKTISANMTICRERRRIDRLEITSWGAMKIPLRELSGCGGKMFMTISTKKRLSNALLITGARTHWNNVNTPSISSWANKEDWTPKTKSKGPLSKQMKFTKLLLMINANRRNWDNKGMRRWLQSLPMAECLNTSTSSSWPLLREGVKNGSMPAKRGWSLLCGVIAQNNRKHSSCVAETSSSNPCSNKPWTQLKPTSKKRLIIQIALTGLWEGFLGGSQESIVLTPLQNGRWLFCRQLPISKPKLRRIWQLMTANSWQP